MGRPGAQGQLGSLIPCSDFLVLREYSLGAIQALWIRRWVATAPHWRVGGCLIQHHHPAYPAFVLFDRYPMSELSWAYPFYICLGFAVLLHVWRGKSLVSEHAASCLHDLYD
jgi:hypothetical protein